jgi:hypothetical protein
MVTVEGKKYFCKVWPGTYRSHMHIASLYISLSYTYRSHILIAPFGIIIWNVSVS